MVGSVSPRRRARLRCAHGCHLLLASVIHRALEVCVALSVLSMLGAIALMSTPCLDLAVFEVGRSNVSRGHCPQTWCELPVDGTRSGRKYVVVCDATGIRRCFEKLGAVVVMLQDAVADLHAHYVSRCGTVCVLLHEARSLSQTALHASRLCLENGVSKDMSKRTCHGRAC
jgi:hypothetical protein